MTLFRTLTRPRNRFLPAAPLLAALILGVIGWWSHDAVRRVVETKLGNELNTILEADVAALEIWVTNQERLAGLLAGDPQIRALAVELVAASSGREQNRGELESLPSQTAFQQILNERVHGAGFGVAEFVTTQLNIIAVAGRRSSRIGSPVSDSFTERYHALFASGKPVLITPFKAAPTRRLGGPGMRRFGPLDSPGTTTGGPQPPLPDRPPPREPSRGDPDERRGPTDRGPGGPGGPRTELNLMQVVAPVRNPAGEVIGALACIVRPEQEFTRVLSVARTGASGETFAFDPAGLLISQSRFDDQLRTLGLLTNSTSVSSSLNVTLSDPGQRLMPAALLTSTNPPIRPLMPMVAEAVAGRSGVNLAATRDYRGILVVGAWRWLPALNFGVITKIDAAEAYEPLRVLRQIFAVLLGLLVVATGVMLLVAFLNVRWRRKFDEAALKARQLGQYTLGEKIGEGAMGVVYRAHHALLRRETAVKLLLPSRADADRIRQFENEVRLTCQLTHPNTIQIYDYGRTDDDIFYYAMEFLSGMTLQELIDQHGAQPEARVLHLLRQICGSLQEAHAAGLIHRDIKPGNLFLCERGGIADTVKVLDFGLVIRMAEVTQGALDPVDSSDASRFRGTPLFMAPECIRKPGFGDALTDIYAVGAVGYMLLVGEPVFQGGNIQDIWRQHLEAIPVAPSVRSGLGISAELEKIILACLAKDPTRRVQSINDLHQAFSACPQAHSWTAADGRAWANTVRHSSDTPLLPLSSSHFEGNRV